jgi:hypothetical protein
MAQSLSEKCKRTGNHFNARATVKPKHTLRGTLTKTEPVRGAQQSQNQPDMSMKKPTKYVGKT